MMSILLSRNFCLGTDLARSKEENLAINESLLSMREEVTIMDKQVKTVSSQIRKISKERKELTMVKEERSQEIHSITEALKKLHLAQDVRIVFGRSN